MRGRVPWSRLLGRQFKFLTVSVFLGFGLSACSDGSEPEEVVQADENAGQESDESVNAELAEESAPASDEVAAADAPQAPEDGVGGTEEGMQPETPAAEPTDDTASVPAEVVSGESSETGAVDAELTADGSSEPDTALASSTPADTAIEESLTQDTVQENVQPEAPVETYAASPYSDGKSVSSPGAAKFIKSKSENGNSTAWKDSGNGGDAFYVVRSGDTLALIASKIYGSPKHYKELAQLNGIGAPYRIYPGDEMKFSTSNKKAQAFAKKLNGSKKTVKVQAGDTLSSIAAKVFGSAYAWKTLAAYNKDKISNPNRITKGMVLAYVDFGGGATTSDAAPKAKKNKKVTVKAGKPIEAKTVNKKKAPITNDTPVEAAPAPEAAPAVVPASAPSDDDLGE